jgi:hypothetical protein
MRHRLDPQIHVSSKEQPANYANTLSTLAQQRKASQDKALVSLAKAVRLVTVVKRTGVL